MEMKVGSYVSIDSGCNCMVNMNGDTSCIKSTTVKKVKVISYSKYNNTLVGEEITTGAIITVSSDQLQLYCKQDENHYENWIPEDIDKYIKIETALHSFSWFGLFVSGLGLLLVSCILFYENEFIRDAVILSASGAMMIVICMCRCMILKHKMRKIVEKGR